MDTDLFMKRWILLMKYCEVKTKKQGYPVFLETHLSVGTLLILPIPALFFIFISFMVLPQANYSGTIVNFYRYFMVL